MKASDQLPAGVAFVSAQGDGSYDSATGVWDLSDATLAKGDVKTITITVDITGEGAGTLVTNVARITHQDQAGDDPTNNESSASFKGGYNMGGTITVTRTLLLQERRRAALQGRHESRCWVRTEPRCSTPTVSP